MSEHLVYLYAVVERGTEAQRRLDARTLPGLEPDEPLFPIAAGGLVAAVSRVPADTFAEAPLNALVADLARLTPYAVRHEAAIRALTGLAPAIVPMMFGAVYRAPERVEALLQGRAGEFARWLDAVRGREEWTLKVFGETARLLAAAERESAVLRELAAEAAGAAPGRAFLLRKRREGLRLAEAERLATAAIEAGVARLAALGAAARREGVAAAGDTASPLLLKASFLVERGSAEAFGAAAAEQARRWEPLGLRAELTGPWAPYSFVGEAAAGSGAVSRSAEPPAGRTVPADPRAAGERDEMGDEGAGVPAGSGPARPTVDG